MEKNFFKDEVERVSRLAYLKLTPEEKEEMTKHFEKMYELVSVLKNMEIDDVPMLIYPHDEMKLALFEDKPEKGLDPIDVIKNAPQSFKEYIKAKSPIKEAKSKE